LLDVWYRTLPLCACFLFPLPTTTVRRTSSLCYCGGYAFGLVCAGSFTTTPPLPPHTATGAPNGAAAAFCHLTTAAALYHTPYATPPPTTLPTPPCPPPTPHPPRPLHRHLSAPAHLACPACHTCLCKHIPLPAGGLCPHHPTPPPACLPRLLTPRLLACHRCFTPALPRAYTTDASGAALLPILPSYGHCDHRLFSRWRTNGRMRPFPRSLVTNRRGRTTVPLPCCARTPRTAVCCLHALNHLRHGLPD